MPDRYGMGTKMGMAVQCILIILEFISFSYVVLGYRPGRNTVKKAVAAAAACLVVALGAVARNTVLVYFLSLLLMTYYFDISITEGIKSWFVAFPALSLLESAILFIFMVFPEIEGDIPRLAAMGSVSVILWLFYLICGRRLGREAFRHRGYSWLIMGLEMFLLSMILTLFMYIVLTCNDRREGMLRIRGRMKETVQRDI